VTVAVALAPGLTLAGLKLTVTPAAAVALSVTAFVKPLLAATATVKVPVFPRVTVSEVDAGVTVSVGTITETPSLAVVVDEPLVALMEMVPVSAAAVAEAVTVAVALAPGLTLAGLKLTVTPFGAVAVSVTGFVKPLLAPTATANVVDCPWKVLTDVALGVRVSVGATTVTGTLNDTVAEPAVPFTAIVPDPAAAVPDAVTVAVALAPAFTLAGLKVTVTPLGAVADSAIGLVKPLLAPTATVNVTACP
jgi:hypothetical protein